LATRRAAMAARVVTGRASGMSGGFGFVEVKEETAAAAIEALNGAEWGGRTLTVNEAQPRPDRRDRRR